MEQPNFPGDLKAMTSGLSIGLALDKVEVDVTYSFQCIVDDLSRVRNAVKEYLLRDRVNQANDSAWRPSIWTGDRTHRWVEGAAAWRLCSTRAKNDESHWSSSLNPHRVGLSPLLKLRPASRAFITQGPSDVESTQEATSLWWHRRLATTFAVWTGKRETQFNGRADRDQLLETPLDGVECLTTLRDSGEATLTFRLNLSHDSLTQAIERRGGHLAPLMQSEGVLPFVFAVLTLARSEVSSGRNGIPFSKIGPLASGPATAKTLHSWADESFEHFLRVTNPADNRHRSSVFHIDRALIDDAACNVPVAQAADEVARDCERHKVAWQLPYTLVFATVGNRDTRIDNNATVHAGNPWWMVPLPSHQASHEFPVLQSGKRVDVARCYKEASLLLLRLYQWRSLLGIDEYLMNPKSPPTPDWSRLFVLREELSLISEGSLFRDLDLVWDPSRVLMLPHGRGTLVLCTGDAGPNSVPFQGQQEAEVAPNFAELLRRATIDAIECARTQWHGPLALSMYVDGILDALAETGALRSTIVMQHVTVARRVFARLLRDRSALGTNAAALSAIRERLARHWRTEQTLVQLERKFATLSHLLGDLHDLKQLQARAQPNGENEDGDKSTGA